MRISEKTLLDKIHGCWIGKNVGGTLGAPYESRQELLDVKYFQDWQTEACANDDLDLQLVWMRILEKRGIQRVDAQVLGEGWLSYIGPHWNEYGTGKSNMRLGLLPPISGEYDNIWKNSNGAWIRSEIWACLCPGNPDKASEFGVYDACVDHGMAEGTYAAIFTTAIESAAFVESDVKKLIDIGLSRIPKDSRLAKCINIVLDAYAEGVDYIEARQRVLDYTLPDLGWFEAPGNVAFVVIGLLYGEGDFKQSVIIATNCGDDTDCTAATVGALYGILLGASGLPKDWTEFIGDKIVTVAIDRGSIDWIPWGCKELTERVYKLTKQANIVFDRKIPIDVVSDDIETEVSDDEKALLYGDEQSTKMCEKSGYEVHYDFIHMMVDVDMMRDPVIEPEGEFEIKFRVRNEAVEPRTVNLEWHLPEGWSVKNAPESIYLRQPSMKTSQELEFTATIVAGPTKKAQNRLILEMIPTNRPTVGLIPIMLL